MSDLLARLAKIAAASPGTVASAYPIVPVYKQPGAGGISTLKPVVAGGPMATPGAPSGPGTMGAPPMAVKPVKPTVTGTSAGRPVKLDRRSTSLTKTSSREGGGMAMNAVQMPTGSSAGQLGSVAGGTGQPVTGQKSPLLKRLAQIGKVETPDWAKGFSAGTTADQTAAQRTASPGVGIAGGVPGKLSLPPSAATGLSERGMLRV